jgi:hypothetical protein
MRTRSALALLCALWFATPAAGAGFEGLDPKDRGPLAVGGRIDAVDEDDRTFRIGGMVFEVPAGVVSFEELTPGRFAEVTYDERGGSWSRTPKPGSRSRAG